MTTTKTIIGNYISILVTFSWGYMVLFFISVQYFC